MARCLKASQVKMSTRNQFLAWDQADKKMRTILLLALVTVARCDQDDCARSVSVALSRQEPQLAVAPDVGGASGPFVRQKIGVSVSWAHVRALLEQNCVHAFLVEYGEESKNQPKSRLQKRESVALNAKISPPFTNGENEFTAELPEDCTVYYFQLVVLLRGADKEVLRSRRRLFWPAGHRADVGAFSGAIVINLAPACAMATDGWRLRICRHEQKRCEDISLTGETPLHLTPLAPCAVYSADLIMASSGVDAISVWTFESLKTLPAPDFEVAPGRRELVMRIKQDKCDAGALVRHWRVTNCKERTQQTPRPWYETEESSGDEEYNYTADDDCAHHMLAAAPSGMVLAHLRHLDKCALYRVEFTPTDAAGRAIQPGQIYGTVESTICNSNDDEFWFDDQSNNREGPPTAPEESLGAVYPYSYYVIGAAVFSVSVLCVLCAAGGKFGSQNDAKERHRLAHINSPKIALLNND